MESTPQPGPGNPDRPFPIIAIGASAGGLNSLVRFLSALPDEFGFALVFVQHLSPTHKSFLPELLSSRKSAVSIEEASDGLEILPGKLYLCPPAQEVRIEKGIFRVTTHSHKHMYLPIDEREPCSTRLASTASHLYWTSPNVNGQKRRSKRRCGAFTLSFHACIPLFCS
ncbi:MAG: chemotaxis protein CheB [Syntrophorhabdales bacterium]|jgi:chemotaxis response regulator CheB